jgi:hypothetical protein
MRGTFLRAAALLAAFGIAATAPVPASAASAGLAVVIANEYDGVLPGATRDGTAIADKLEASGFTGVRLLGAAGGAMTAGVEQIHKAAEGAGPFRIVYLTGFGMCLNDDLMLFAEDMQPAQFESGQLGDVVIPVSVVAESAAAGGEQTLVVFDTDPKQCTDEALKAIKLPEKTALLVTTSIGGDVVDEIEEGGNGAFATAFLQAFAPERAPKEILDKTIEQIKELTEELQVPILIGGL